MRLDLKARQSRVRVSAGRYQRSSKKEKGKISENSFRSTGYRRCYASKDARKRLPFKLLGIDSDKVVSTRALTFPAKS